ncbi:hypothetical protein C8J36_101120 [Rhizobium sp. PP-F2F-G48]|uniref:DUF6894 family protein n=1 Tax=Rhizobium sp. PP-F2F-G48 TaxID=2135651 RepID=UPI00104EAF3D|nr:hypothetical protein [Rhizobium sp. PP-F2F-G48]TCM58221.1 hypothetical protein C8J36_101120 [Rhizobium sp. PP-F2F-G48]
MPRYFFNVHDFDETFIDEDGIELPDDGQAKHEAILAARELVMEKVRSGDLIADQTIEVQTPEHPLFVIPLRAVINIKIDLCPCRLCPSFA